VSQKEHVKKLKMLMLNLDVELEPLELQTRSSRKLSQKLIDVIERKTDHFATVELKQTSPNLHIDFERRCDVHAEDEESLHWPNHHRQFPGPGCPGRFCTLAIILCAFGRDTR